jgi:glycosyltransferase involved in cell wall biosynthesis
MKITLVSPFNTTPGSRARGNGHAGGVERVYAEISQRLASRGHEVTLVCSSARQTGETVEGGVRVIRGTRHLTVLRTPVARLAGRIPTDSDLLQVPATYPFTTPTSLQRAKRLRIPAVLDFHFEPAPARPIPRVAAATYRVLGPRSYRHADVVLVRSMAYGRSAPSLSGIPEKRWRVVPNGIDPERFRADAPGTPPAGDYVLFVGRLVPYKGLDVLLAALARWPLGMPTLIAGGGPLRKQLEARARRLGADVRFLGHVPEESLPTLYRGARLTVLPSVNQQEAFGIVLLESMACGTPVVASRLPGVADLASLGGLTARPGDAADLAHAMHRALAGDTLPRGRALATAVHAGYSWDAVTDRLEAAYEQVASRRREVRPLAHPGGHAVL